MRVEGRGKAGPHNYSKDKGWLHNFLRFHDLGLLQHWVQNSRQLLRISPGPAGAFKIVTDKLDVGHCFYFSLPFAPPEGRPFLVK